MYFRIRKLEFSQFPYCLLLKEFYMKTPFSLLVVSLVFIQFNLFKCVSLPTDPDTVPDNASIELLLPTEGDLFTTPVGDTVPVTINTHLPEYIDSLVLKLKDTNDTTICDTVLVFTGNDLIGEQLTLQLIPNKVGARIIEAKVYIESGKIKTVTRLVTVSGKAAKIINPLPDSISVNEGARLTIELEYSGTPPFSFQWYKDDNKLTDDTSATLSLAGVSTDAAGEYRCEVTNPYTPEGTIIRSSTCKVTVIPADKMRLRFSGETVIGAGEICSLTISIDNDTLSPESITFSFDGDIADAGITDGLFTWETTPEDTGTIDIVFTATDSLNRFSFTPLTVTISIRTPESNLPPTITIAALNDQTSISVTEGRTILFTVTASDRNAGDVATLLPLDTSPWDENGSGSYDTATGAFSYTPAFDATGGTDPEKDLGNFIFSAVDNGSPPETASVEITILVLDSNSAPHWQVDTLFLQAVEGMEISRNLSTSCTDAEGDQISFSTDLGEITGNTWKWVPPFSAENPTVATITAGDSHIPEATALVTLVITLADSNRIPVAYDNLSVHTVEDSAVAIDITAADPDSTTLSFEVSNPVKGTLSGEPPHLVYTPPENFAGSDTFTFYVSDGIARSNDATILIEVVAVNDPPEFATVQKRTVNEGGQIPAIDLSDFVSDQDNAVSTLQFSAAPRGPMQVIVDSTNILLITAPDTNWFGSDTIDLSVKDPAGAAASVSVVCEVLPVNDAPEITIGADITVSEDAGPRTFANWATAVRTGPENEADQKATVSVTVNRPSLFSSSPHIDTEGTLTFTPATDSIGTAELEVIVRDDGGTARSGVDSSSRSQFTITIANTNDLPVILSQVSDLSVNEDSPLIISIDDLEIQDIDNPDGPFSLAVRNGTGYTFSGTTITPAADFTGTLSVPVTVSDGTNTSNPFTLSVTVVPVNDPPVITGPKQSLAVNEDASLTLVATDFIISDPDNPTGPFTLSIAPGSNYTVTNSTVTPATDFNGTIQVGVTANDGAASGPSYSATITVQAVNDAPVITGLTAPLAVDEDDVLTVTAAMLSITDPDNTTFTVSAASGLNYTVSGSAGIIPAANYNGTLQVPLTVSDGTTSSASYTAAVTVTPVNDPPVVATIPGQTISEGGSFATIPLDDYVTDPDNSNAQISWSISPASPTNLTVGITSRVASLTVKDPEWNGTEIITFIADDGDRTDSRAVSFAVSGVNDPPVLSGVSDRTVAENELCTFTVTATDPDGPTPSITATGLPSGANFNNGVFSWTPDYDQAGGPYAVTFTATDGNDATVTTQHIASINVTNTDRAPRFTSIPSNQSVSIGTSYAASVIAVDDDGDAVSYSVVSGPSGLTISGATVSWTPNRLSVATGTQPVTVRATANGKTTDANWSISVTAHVWQKFSSLPINYHSGSRVLVSFPSSTACYRSPVQSTAAPLERLTIGENNWSTTSVTPAIGNLYELLIAGSTVMVRNTQWVGSYNLSNGSEIVRVSGSSTTSNLATRGDGLRWYFGIRSAGMGGCVSRFYITGVSQWSSTADCYQWDRIAASQSNNSLCALTENTTYRYSSDGSADQLINNTVTLTGGTYTGLAGDRNNLDTVFVLDSTGYSLRRTTSGLSSPSFSSVGTVTSLSPVKITMSSGYVGWIVGKTGTVYFTNNGFATEPVAETTSDGKTILQVHIASDGSTEFAVGRDDGSGELSLYQY